MSVLDLARPEIVALQAYSSARAEAPARGVLLNANELPWPLLETGTDTPGLNRYPEPQPGELVRSLARLYGMPEDCVLLTRGSDEGIDLLTRAFCRAGQDAVLHCPPTFGMYRIAAQIQGAGVVSVPRLREQDFRIDTAAVLRAVADDPAIRLLFLASPNSPTGDAAEPDFLQQLLEACRGRAVVVIDEAYAEFCSRPSATGLIPGHENLVVLRTLSKAWASAGLRCGVLLAQAPVIALLRRIIAPYPLASPVIALALRVLQPDMAAAQQRFLQAVARNKQLLLEMLQSRAFVRALWPGEANFVLVQVDDAAGLLAHCARLSVVLRGYRGEPALRDCLRITVGSEDDIAALGKALELWER